MELGLCCINTILRKQKPPVFNSRACIRKNFTVEKAKELALQNVKDILTMLKWCNDNDIRCFRLSSDVFPHFTDPETESYTIDFAIKDLQKAGDYANKHGIRVVMHPGQYNQVGTIYEDVFQKTVADLQHHAEILDAMNIGKNGVLIVHGGGLYKKQGYTKNDMIERWANQYFDLPLSVRNRLVLENCEKCFDLEDVLEISDFVSALGGDLPVVFDSHHYECYGILHPDTKQKPLEELLPKVIKTWGDRRVLMHVSNQGDGRIGHHSDYIYDFPKCFTYVSQVLKVPFDLEVEAKMKEQAIFALRKVFTDQK